MTLQSQSTDQLARIIARYPERSVSVVIGGVSGQGVREALSTDSSLDVNGESGQSAFKVRVSGSTFSEPARGSAITVGGRAAIVTNTLADALITITGYFQRPVVNDPKEVG